MLGVSSIRKIMALALFAAAGFAPWHVAMAKIEAAEQYQSETMTAKADAPLASSAALAETIENIDRALSEVKGKKPQEIRQAQEQTGSVLAEAKQPAAFASRDSSYSVLLVLSGLTFCCALVVLGLTLYHNFKTTKAASGAMAEAGSGFKSAPDLPDDGSLKAFDGNVLNREQALAEKLLDVCSTDPVPEYDALIETFNVALKEKFTQAKYEAFVKHVKEKFGDMNEVKFAAFERLDQIDRLTYFANFSKERLVVIRISFTKEGRVERFQLNPYKKQPENSRLGDTQT